MDDVGRGDGPDAQDAKWDLTEAGLQASFERIEQAERELRTAKHALANAKTEATLRLWAVARPYRDGDQPTPTKLIAELYWDHPELRASDIGRAFGYTTARLAELAGTRTDTARCTSCEQELTWIRHRRSSTPPQECDPCHGRSAARHEASRRRGPGWDGDPWERELPDPDPRGDRWHPITDDW